MQTSTQANGGSSDQPALVAVRRRPGPADSLREHRRGFPRRRDSRAPARGLSRAGGRSFRPRPAAVPHDGVRRRRLRAVRPGYLGAVAGRADATSPARRSRPSISGLPARPRASKIFSSSRSRRTTWSNGSSSCCPALPPTARLHIDRQRKRRRVYRRLFLCAVGTRGSGLGKSPARIERSEPRVPSPEPDRTYFFGRRKIESSGTALNSTVVIVHCSIVLPSAVWVTVWGIMIPSTCL